MDSIHDVTLQAGDRTFAAHKYILSMRSEFFRKLFMSDHCGIGEELGGEARKSEDAVGCDLIILENIPADMLEYALDFIYTDSCELLVHKAKPSIPAAQTEQTKVGKSIFSIFAIAVQNVCIEGLCLFHQDYVHNLFWPGVEWRKTYQ